MSFDPPGIVHRLFECRAVDGVERTMECALATQSVPLHAFILEA